MNIVLNDQRVMTEAKTVEGLMQELELMHQPVVVEVNGSVVYREHWKKTELTAGMKIELVQFVGGG